MDVLKDLKKVLAEIAAKDAVRAVILTGEGRSFVAGADIVTAGLAVYKDSMKHPYTRQGIETFQDAWDKTAKE